MYQQVIESVHVLAYAQACGAQVDVYSERMVSRSATLELCGKSVCVCTRARGRCVGDAWTRHEGLHTSN